MDEMKARLKGAFYGFLTVLVVIGALIILVGLQGCAVPQATGSAKVTEVENTFTQDGSNNTLVVILSDAALEGGDMGDVAQEALQDASNPIDVPVDIDADMIPSTEKAAAIIPILTPDKAKQKPVVTPKAPEARPAEADSEKYTMTFRLNHNRPFTWLKKTGADFKAPVTFTTMPSGYTLVVADPTDNYKDKGLYFCGTKNRPAEANGNRASFFGPTGSKDLTLLVQEGVQPGVETYKTLQVNGRSHATLPWAGEDKAGESLKFTFGDDCGALLVADPTKPKSQNGNLSESQQAFYFPGTNGSPATVMTRPGCVTETVTVRKE